MEIRHIGHSAIHTPSRNLVLKNILHIPEAAKNLISVHKLAADNNAFLEFHPTFFLVKDKATKKILLQGKCRHGLYPVPPGSLTARKLAYGAMKPSPSTWHNHLGHPSFSVVHQVISKNNLPCASESNKQSICDAC